MKQFAEAKASSLGWVICGSLMEKILTHHETDPRNCFLLHTKECIFIWVGSECPAVLIEAAKKWAKVKQFSNTTDSIQDRNSDDNKTLFLSREYNRTEVTKVRESTRSSRTGQSRQ